MKISACITVWQERQQLARCLESIAGYVDEIIVIETEPAANISDVAALFDAVTVAFPAAADQADAWSYGASLAGGEWLLMLDADEYLTAEGAANLGRVIKHVEEEPQVEGVRCQVRDYTEGWRYIEQQSVRLLRADKRLLFTGIAKKPQLEGRPAAVKVADADVLCVEYDGLYGEERCRYYRQELQRLSDGAGRYDAHQAAKYHAYLQEYDLAVQQGIAALRQDKGRQFVHEYGVLPYLAIIEGMYRLPEKYTAEQLSGMIKGGLYKFPVHPQLYYWLGQACRRQGKLSAALRAFLTALRCQQRYQAEYENGFPIYLPQTYYEIAELYADRHELSQARNYYRLALAADKYNETYLAGCLRCLEAGGQAEVREVLQELYCADDSLDAAFIGSQLVMVKLGQEAEAFYQPFFQEEQMPYPQLARAIAALGQGQYEEGAACLKTYLEAAPGCQPAECYWAAAVLLGGRDGQRADRLLVSGSHLTGSDNAASEAWFAKECPEKKFADLLMVMVQLASEDQLNEFLAMAPPLSLEEYEKAGAVLLRHGYYQQAADVYGQALDQADDPAYCANVCSKACIAHYHLKNYDKVVEDFLLYAYTGYELCQYLEWVMQQCSDSSLAQRAQDLRTALLIKTMQQQQVRCRLQLGCGRRYREGWLNLDLAGLDGVDIVFDLNSCHSKRLPLPDNSIEEFYGWHILEHIDQILPLMQELYRAAKPGARAVFSVPYGSSDDADEHPGHVRRFFLKSFDYFSQLEYWRADQDYQGDWQVEKITLAVDEKRYGQCTGDEIMQEVRRSRNVVQEMTVELKAIKPGREYGQLRPPRPQLDIRLIPSRSANR